MSVFYWHSVAQSLETWYTVIVGPWQVCSAAVHVNNVPLHALVDIVGCYAYFDDVYAPCEPAQTPNLVNYVYDGVIMEALWCNKHWLC